MPLIVEKIDAILSRHDMPRYLISIIEQSIQIRVKGVLMAPEQRWISVDFLSTLLLFYSNSGGFGVTFVWLNIPG